MVHLDVLCSYLHGIGLADVRHTHEDLLAHLVGTYRQLAGQRLPEHIQLAGLFHSIYGTEGFPRQTITLAQRPNVRRLIGTDAEQLVYKYCAMSYASLQRSVEERRPLLEDRFTGRPMALTESTFEDLLWIKLADAAEQASEQTMQSRFFRTVAELLGPRGVQYWGAVRPAH